MLPCGSLSCPNLGQFIFFLNHFVKSEAAKVQKNVLFSPAAPLFLAFPLRPAHAHTSISISSSHAFSSASSCSHPRSLTSYAIIHPRHSITYHAHTMFPHPHHTSPHPSLNSHCLSPCSAFRTAERPCPVPSASEMPVCTAGGLLLYRVPLKSRSVPLRPLSCTKMRNLPNLASATLRQFFFTSSFASFTSSFLSRLLLVFSFCLPPCPITSSSHLIPQPHLTASSHHLSVAASVPGNA